MSITRLEDRRSIYQRQLLSIDRQWTIETWSVSNTTAFKTALRKWSVRECNKIHRGPRGTGMKRLGKRATEAPAHGEMFCVHELKSILLGCQFLPTWPTGPKWPQSVSLPAVLETVILNFIWKRTSRTATTMLKKKKVGSLPLSAFKSYYKATRGKSVGQWLNNSHIHQWNRILKNPDIDLSKYSKLIFDIGMKEAEFMFFQQMALEQSQKDGEEEEEGNLHRHHITAYIKN